VTLTTTRWDLSGTYDHPHWLAHVCSGLADRGVSVIAGQAVRRAGGTWDAHLDVDTSRAVVPVAEADVASIAGGARIGRDLVDLRLASAAVTRLPDLMLQVDVSAADELGFLGRLLRRVSLYGLYPSEVRVSTSDGVVHDRLVLTGIGASIPNEGVAQQLADVLSARVLR
jgi:hypothetical protein